MDSSWSSAEGDAFGGSDWGTTGGGYGNSQGGGSGTKPGGIIMNLFNTFDPNARRYKKARWSNMRFNAQAQIDAIARKQASFADESQRNTEELQQDMYSRGLGQSSIGTENEAYYERVKERTTAQLGEDMKGAESNRRLVNAQINYERKSQYAQLLDSIVNTAASML